MKAHCQHEFGKRGLSMTSMIDIVFLLLVFFVMTFQIVEMEGDFRIRLPSNAEPSQSTDLPLQLRMRSNQEGQLVSMSLGDVDLGVDFKALRAVVLKHVGNTVPADGNDCPEIVIDTDFNLRYAYVIQAITAVSGYKNGDEVIKLIEKVKFAKPRR